jgi:hypothetical protein
MEGEGKVAWNKLIIKTPIFGRCLQMLSHKYTFVVN